MIMLDSLCKIIILLRIVIPKIYVFVSPKIRSCQTSNTIRLLTLDTISDLDVR